jgi:DNA-binding NtrC family response regulator
MNDKILVIDDQYATDEDVRDAFLAAVAPTTRTTDGLSSRMPRISKGDFEFHSGQDSSGLNSEEAVVAKVTERWSKDSSTVRDRWSLILLDLQFDETGRKINNSVRSDPQFGFAVFDRLRREFDADLPIVMLTTHTERKSDANEAGPEAFLAKFSEREAAGFYQQFARCYLESALIPDLRSDDKLLVGNSVQWMKVLREARRFALNPIGIYLILGESGSGKTELARYMHHYSGRSGHFESYTARPTNQDLMPNELFGYWYGGHNKADRSQAGKIEQCHGGTFFLDEIPNLPTDAQKALLELRGTDENGLRSIARLGFFPSAPPARVTQANDSIVQDAQRDGNKVKVDVMLLTATNRDLRDEAVRKETHFQFDLYNRLGGPLVVPSLNERREDVPEIFAVKVREGARQLGCQRPITISPKVNEILQNLDYSVAGRGNVAFLERIAAHALMQLQGYDEIIPRRLPPDVVTELGGRSGGASRAQTTATSALSVSSPLQVAGVAPAELNTQSALAKAAVNDLRRNVDLLEKALIETRERNRSTGLPGDFIPAAALAQLLGLEKVEGADIGRHLNEILGSILNRAEYLAAPLRQYGFNDLVDYVKSRPILMEHYRYATEKKYTMKMVNEALKNALDEK